MFSCRSNICSWYIFSSLISFCLFSLGLVDSPTEDNLSRLDLNIVL